MFVGLKNGYFPKQVLSAQIFCAEQDGIDRQTLEKYADTPIGIDTRVKYDTCDLHPIASAAKVYVAIKNLLSQSSNISQADSKNLIFPVAFSHQFNSLIMSTLVNSETFGEALELSSHAFYLQSFSAPSYFINKSDKDWTCGFFRHMDAAPTFLDKLMLNDLAHLFWWYKIYSNLLDESISVTEITLPAPSRGVKEYCVYLFGVAPSYRKDVCSFSFSTAYGNRKIKRHNNDVAEHWRHGNIDQALTQQPSARASNAALFTNQYLYDTKNERFRSEEEVAELLSMSSITLRRKLKESQTSFRKLKEQQQCQLAVNLLETSQESLTKIAARLGYANLSGFSRAFKAWMDISPQDYRKVFEQKQQPGHGSGVFK